MQEADGYFENGHFFTTDKVLRVQGKRRAYIRIFDEPVYDEATASRLAAIDEFFAAIETSGEETPEFERVKFNREASV
ncbi:MAG: hypothetical protein LBC28_00380 [Oscillospiraceae bacterium]|jgi:hypothetical protein|nr:hypothetical protein [Oscillospiraceae bacterium]